MFSTGTLERTIEAYNGIRMLTTRALTRATNA